MNQKRIPQILGRSRRLLVIVLFTLLSVGFASLPVSAQSAVVDPYRLLTTIRGADVPPSSPFWAFGQGWIDPGTHRYYLTDVTNRRVDVIDTRANQLIMTIGGFTGVSGLAGDSRRIGPSGLAGDQHGHLFVGDGNSTLNIIDLASHHMQTVSTGGQGRVDALVYDPVRRLALATNSADVPPFVSVIDTRAHRLLGRLALPFATAGVEQLVR